MLLAYNIDTGQRHLQVFNTKTKKDYSSFMQWIATEVYPHAQKIILVQDNYKSHFYGAFYETLALSEAHSLRQKIEFHFTPKHTSWLNMAEIEFSALAKQCLDRRITDQHTLFKEALIWQQKSNEQAIKVHWSFTTDKARTKFKQRSNDALNQI